MKNNKAPAVSSLGPTDAKKVIALLQYFRSLYSQDFYHNMGQVEELIKLELGFNLNGTGMIRLRELINQSGIHLLDDMRYSIMELPFMDEEEYRHKLAENPTLSTNYLISMPIHRIELLAEKIIEKLDNNEHLSFKEPRQLSDFCYENNIYAPIDDIQKIFAGLVPELTEKERIKELFLNDSELSKELRALLKKGMTRVEAIVHLAVKDGSAYQHATLANPISYAAKHGMSLTRKEIRDFTFHLLEKNVSEGYEVREALDALPIKMKRPFNVFPSYKFLIAESIKLDHRTYENVKRNKVLEELFFSLAPKYNIITSKTVYINEIKKSYKHIRTILDRERRTIFKDSKDLIDTIDSELMGWLMDMLSAPIDDNMRGFKFDEVVQVIAKELEVIINEDTFKKNISNIALQQSELLAERLEVGRIGINKNINLYDYIHLIKIPSELKQYIGVNTQPFIDKGIMIGMRPASLVSLSANWRYAVQETRAIDVLCHSTNALAELSRDIFQKKVKTDKLTEGLKEQLENSSQVIKHLDSSKKTLIVREAAAKLFLDKKTDFWIQEIKFEILLKGYYLSNKEIENVLTDENFPLIEVYTDTIGKRIRLAKRINKTQYCKIEIVDKLPGINANEKRCLLVHKEAVEKFQELWIEFAEILLKQNLIGHVSKTPIDEKWNGDFSELIDKYDPNGSYRRAFLVEEIFGKNKTVNLQTLSSLAIYCSDNTKDSLNKMFWSLRARSIGFFLFLTKKGLALMNPTYIYVTGANVFSSTLKLFTKGHPIYAHYKQALKHPTLDKQEKEKLESSFNIKHLQYFAAASSWDADPKEFTREELDGYFSAVGNHITPSGACGHESFMSSTLFFGGNFNATKSIETFNPEAYYEELITQLDEEIVNRTLTNYSHLFTELFNAAKYRYEEEQLSIGMIKKYIVALTILLEFLGTKPRVLDRDEIVRELNPIHRVPDGYYDFLKIKDKHAHEQTSFLHTLFSTIQHPMFVGLFPKQWITKKPGALVLHNKNTANETTRRLIREGLEMPVLDLLREVAIKNPPELYASYDFIKTKTVGEWWPHRFSPIPTFCNWIVTKIPRRGINIAYLDVDSFMQYDDFGNFIGLYFSTDKNRFNPNLFISISSVKLLFTDEEFVLLKNYVDYIKEAYHYMLPVEYKRHKSLVKIKPLFPGQKANVNDVIPMTLVNGYLKKCMYLVQKEIRRLASIGGLDHYYEEDIRPSKIKMLSEIELVRRRQNSSVKWGMESIPFKPESAVDQNYSIIQRLHNLRHAGATALVHTGTTLAQIQEITGHASSVILQLVYLHSGKEELKSIQKKVAPDLKEVFDEPHRNGIGYLRKVLSPLTKVDNPKVILESLKKNNFMSLTRTVMSADKTVYGTVGEVVVENGLEIASRYHPDISWDYKVCGICTMKDRCPDGSRGVCCLCPHMLFNATFIEGIIMMHQTTARELMVVQNKLYEARRDQSNSARNELQKRCDELVYEFLGWQEMVDMVRSQITNVENQMNISKKNLPSINGRIKQTQKIRLMPVTLNQAALEILSTAKKFKFSDMNTENMINKLSLELFLKATRGSHYDSELICKMAEQKLDWLLDEYGAAESVEERNNIFLKYFDKLDSENSIIYDPGRQLPSSESNGDIDLDILDEEE